MSDKLHVIQHPLVQHKLTMLRNQETGVKDFRACVSELATLLCYEATKDIPLRECEIETPMGRAKGMEIEGKTVAIVPILRAGLGMVPGILTLIPSAKVGHIGIYRDPESLQPVEYYCKMPTDIATREVLLLEPLMATGTSASAAIQFLKNYSCRKIKLLSIVVSPEGTEQIFSDHPDVEIYCAAVDEQVSKDGYLVPGVGDAGDRMFGTK